jgi:hypothetical protein
MVVSLGAWPRGWHFIFCDPVILCSQPPNPCPYVLPIHLEGAREAGKTKTKTLFFFAPRTRIGLKIFDFKSWHRRHDMFALLGYLSLLVAGIGPFLITGLKFGWSGLQSFNAR